jgi:hypothetical protein
LDIFPTLRVKKSNLDNQGKSLRNHNLFPIV